MKIISLPVESLVHPKRNVRRHPEKQINELVKSVQQFGQTRPVVVDETNTILAGNGLVMALAKLGIEKASVMRVSGLSDKDKKKLMLSDNRIFELAAADSEIQMDFLREIAIDGDLEVPGFDKEVLEMLMADSERIDEEVSAFPVDDSPVENSRPVTETIGGSTQESTQIQDRPNSRVIVCPSCGENINL